MFCCVRQRLRVVSNCSYYKNLRGLFAAPNKTQLATEQIFVVLDNAALKLANFIDHQFLTIDLVN